MGSENSVTYGVTGKSPLNDIQHFHVACQLPQDVMHVLLEGVVPNEVQLMLYDHIIVKKLYTLGRLNERIACFSYASYEASDKPTIITANALKGESTLKQSCKLMYNLKVIATYFFLIDTAAQMWILSINLPLMIGDLIPTDDEMWECFLLLLDILQLCTTRVASRDQAGYLEALISMHHQRFISCYPLATMTPKMHYMVHFPQQITRLIRLRCIIISIIIIKYCHHRTGPLINTWCMRMEAKNKYFKETAHRSNFKNVCLTVAKRHQRLLCSYLLSSQFFERDVDCGPGVFTACHKNN